MSNGSVSSSLDLLSYNKMFNMCQGRADTVDNCGNNIELQVQMTPSASKLRCLLQDNRVTRYNRMLKYLIFVCVAYLVFSGSAFAAVKGIQR